MDKGTQVEGERGGQGCERCETLWSILNGTKSRATMRTTEGRKSPKVIGKFVFAEMMDRRNAKKTANYGTMMDRESTSSRGDEAEEGGGTESPELDQKQKEQDSKRSSSWWRGHSQGETLIMNERSFLI